MFRDEIICICDLVLRLHVSNVTMPIERKTTATVSSMEVGKLHVDTISQMVSGLDISYNMHCE